MLHRWSRLTLKGHLKTLSTLVCHLTAFVLLAQRGGQCEMIAFPEPIVAMIGEDVILPCHLDSCTNVVSMTLEWTRLDLNPTFVHVRQDGEEILLDQNPAFVGRASSSAENMQHGDLSLKLSKVRISDEGTYRCQMPGMGSSEVLLFVGAVSSPVVLMGDISSSGLGLQCESSGWYPEPEVLWLDGEGNLLSPESAETVKGGDDLYSVSSRMTVERRNNIITCKVQQKKISQTRETNVQILDVYSASSNSAPRVGVVVAVTLLMLSAVFFVLWRMKQRREDKKSSDEESKKEEEEERLVKEEKEANEKRFREMKKEEGEEKKNMSEVLLLVEDWRRELKNKRDEQRTELEKVEKDLEKNKKLCKKENKKMFGNPKSFEQIICELDKQKMLLCNSQESTEKTLKRTSDIISKFDLQKPSSENETNDMKPDKDTEIQQDQEKSKVLEREEENKHRDVSMTEGQENEA